MWLITVFKEDANNLIKFNQSWQYNTCLGVLVAENISFWGCTEVNFFPNEDSKMWQVGYAILLLGQSGANPSPVYSRSLGLLYSGFILYSSHCANKLCFSHTEWYLKQHIAFCRIWPKFFKVFGPQWWLPIRLLIFCILFSDLISFPFSSKETNN